MKSRIKPRNPFVALAKFRKAGPHEKPAKSLRRHDKQALVKTTKQSPESWHKCISRGCSSAITSAVQPQGLRSDANRGVQRVKRSTAQPVGHLILAIA
jgi:hypothetical protein